MPIKPPKPWWKTLDADDVSEAYEEATVDCYGDEVIGALVEMTMQELVTPFKGKALGQVVDVVEVTTASTTDNDLDFICKVNGKLFAIAARSVELSKPLPNGHLLLAALFDYQSRG
ncbi:MAG: hypothetical protein R3C19_24810 [Planctomycetaceae bacterium]